MPKTETRISMIQPRNLGVPMVKMETRIRMILSQVLRVFKPLKIGVLKPKVETMILSRVLPVFKPLKIAVLKPKVETMILSQVLPVSKPSNLPPVVLLMCKGDRGIAVPLHRCESSLHATILELTNWPYHFAHPSQLKRSQLRLHLSLRTTSLMFARSRSMSSIFSNSYF
jgi:hypothetical protein